jgi:voltage-gated potassium channel
VDGDPRTGEAEAATNDRSTRGITPETGPMRRPVLLALIRTLGTLVGILVIYYLLPLDSRFGLRTISELLAGIVVVGALVAWHIRLILNARYPALRAMESLALTVPLFLVLFASAYIIMAGTDSHAFSQTLTRTDALYFVVTVFATVGFGDITAVSEPARILVTVQMLSDLVVIGLLVRAIIGAVQRTGVVARRGPRRSEDRDG